MVAYATVEDIQARMSQTMTEKEESICSALLEDAAVIIDNYNANASEDAKQVVSCRMVVRALGAYDSQTAPVGATQGSISALGYSQSWTIGSGSVGEIYLGKAEKTLLGVGNKIGSHSPIESLKCKWEGF